MTVAAWVIVSALAGSLLTLLGQRVSTVVREALALKSSRIDAARTDADLALSRAQAANLTAEESWAMVTQAKERLDALERRLVAVMIRLGVDPGNVA